jgi:uncharacterized membrane protein (UPF0127 family)
VTLSAFRFPSTRCILISFIELSPIINRHGMDIISTAQPLIPSCNPRYSWAWTAILFVSFKSMSCAFGGDETSGGSDGQTPDVSPTPEPLIVITATSSQPSVLIADQRFDVELAYTPESKYGGQGGRDSIPVDTGMLYIYASGEPGDAWMTEMLFPLDFFWIGADRRIADTHPSDPEPISNTPNRLLTTYWSIIQATHVPETNACTISELGIKMGDQVSFDGFLERGDT